MSRFIDEGDRSQGTLLPERSGSTNTFRRRTQSASLTRSWRSLTWQGSGSMG
jgi:hypothetical protein